MSLAALARQLHKASPALLTLSMLTLIVGFASAGLAA